VGGRDRPTRLKGFTMGAQSTRALPVTNSFQSSCIPNPNLLRKYDRIIHADRHKRTHELRQSTTNQVKAPGPAYYNPDKTAVIGRKNYRLNTTNTWVV
jgi:hypothetical protein